ncbi:hypothetical protein MJO29_006072 [Puccinia striiformis f. sp. tritici]|nr:hypothetical protein MJO29_006072 [Puccinia striiformis f. sp. tritici]
MTLWCFNRQIKSLPVSPRVESSAPWTLLEQLGLPSFLSSYILIFLAFTYNSKLSSPLLRSPSRRFAPFPSRLGLHRVWAKYEHERWSYADQDGNLVDNPDAYSHQSTSSSAQSGTELKPSHNSRRERLTYQGVYEEEEGELASQNIDRGPTAQQQRKAANKEDTDDQEEGELDSIEEALLDFHDSIPAPEPPRPFPIRLLALPKSRSSAVDPNRNLLILQPGLDEPMVIGRDRTFEPSLRLKEMEVSKTHATIFWSADGEHASHGWHIVDNASTHGTFISPSATQSRTSPKRLSEARKASVPYKLNHLDTIMVASADHPLLSFQVHLHPRFPSSCQSCALYSDESNRMSLESQQPAPTEVSKTVDTKDEERYAMSPADVKVERERKRKIEMAKLRNQFFGEDAEPSTSKKKKMKKPERLMSETIEQPQKTGEEEEANQYLDRAKLRRQTHGRTTSKPNHQQTETSVRPKVVESNQEPDPMRRGTAMLAKLGGTDTDGLKSMGTLIEARTLGTSQAGLGSRQLLVGVENIGKPKDWRQEAKMANWKRYAPP